MLGRFTAASIMLLLVACGATGTLQPPAIDPGALPSPSSFAMVGRQDLLDEAVDPDSVAAALDAAGFLTGAERIARDRAARVRETSVRVLRFASDGGARAWVDYVRADPVDVLGAVSAAGTSGDAAIYRHLPDGCCPGKDLPSWTALAVSGAAVTIVTVRGPDVTQDDLAVAMAAAGLTSGSPGSGP